MMKFRENEEHVPGKQLVVADTLSRNPFSVPSKKSGTEEEARAYVDSAEIVRRASPEKMERIKQATSSEFQLSRVLDCTVNGWEKYASDVPEEIRPYFAVCGDLSVTDGKIFYRHRLVIPPVLQSEVLERIHDGNQGIIKCRERAVCICHFGGLALVVVALETNLQCVTFAKRIYLIRERNHLLLRLSQKEHGRRLVQNMKGSSS